MAKFKRRYNGTGTVTKLSGNRRKPWVARGSGMTDEGRHTQPIIGTYETEKEALRALDEWNTVHKPKRGKQTFKNVYDAVYAEKVKDKLTESGLQSVRSSVQHWKPLYDRIFDELTIDDYQKLIDKRIGSKTPPSLSVLTKDRSIVKQMYDHQISKGLDIVNIAPYMKFRGTTQEKVSAFTDLHLQQIKTLYENPEYKDAVASSMILAYTGLRINEFLSLKQKDIHLDEFYLYTDGSKTDSGRSRKIPIHKTILPYLQHLLAADSEYLFSRKRQKVSDNYYRRAYHKPLMEKIKCTLTPHSFRHTAATKYRMAGVSERAISDILGHKTTRVTDDNYVDLPVEYLVSEVAKVE